MIASLFKKQHRFSLSRALGVTIAVAGLMAQGCIGDDEGGFGLEDGSLPGGSEDSNYSIKSYIRRDGEAEFQLIETRPFDSPIGLAGPSASEERETNSWLPWHSTSQPGEMRSKEQPYVYRTEDGEDVEVNDVPWFLAYQAARSCVVELGGYWLAPDATVRDTSHFIAIWGEPFQSGDTDLPKTCDIHLLQQQNMLCTAEKLAAVADALEPQTWHTYGGGTIIIPAQSDEDRFIVRDQALIILDQLSRMMVKSPATLRWGTTTTAGSTYKELFSGTLAGSCAENYVRLNSNTALLGTSSSSTSFYSSSQNYPAYLRPSGVPSDGGIVLGRHSPAGSTTGNLGLGDDAVTINASNVPTLLAPRMKLQAHIARASGRLARKLVEDSVRADVAGAEALATLSVSDAWAMDPKKNLGGYNTYRHAVRTILGSWEPAPTTPALAASPYLGARSDPACNGYANVRYTTSSNDFTAAMPGFNLELKLGKPSTPGQSLAWSLFRSTGLVLPVSMGGAGTSPTATTIRAVLRFAVLANAAKRAGVTDDAGFATFAASPAGKALAESVASISDEDLVFADRRSRRAYSVLIGTSTQVSAASTLLPATSLTSAPGAAQESGLAATGAFTVNGGMPEHDLGASAMGRFGPAGRTCSSNAKDMIRRFSDTLKVLKVGQAASIASLGVDEFKDVLTDSGTIRVTSANYDPQPTAPTWTLGFETATAVGIPAVKDMIKGLILVQGTALEAECVAGLRTRCEGVNVQTIKLVPTVADYGGTYTDRTALVKFASSVPKPSTKPAWVISPPKGAQVGGILAMTDSNANGVVAFTDWELRLLRSIQTGRAVPDAGCAASYDPTPRDYCVEGMERDMFVPVSNALTGEGADVDESWRHYLDLAKAAAAEADELGVRIIEQGLSKDLRREDAQAELGQLCGGFPVETDLVTADGEASACLDEDTVDVVYFAQQANVLDDPALAAQARTDLIATVCALAPTEPSNPSSPLAAPNDELCTRAHNGSALVAKSLDFDAIGEEPPAVGESYCQTVLADAGLAVTGGFSGGWDGAKKQEYELRAVAGDFRPAAMAAAASRLRLQVGVDGRDWVLWRGTRALLAWVDHPGGTDTTTAGNPAPGLLGEFPGCVHQQLNCSANGACCSPDAKAVASAMGINVATLGSTPSFFGSTNASLNKRTWRATIESALWSLAYVGGSMPEGMVTIPVPAALWDSTQPYTTNLQTSAPSNGFVPAVYYGAVLWAGSRASPRLNGTTPSVDTWVGLDGNYFIKEETTGGTSWVGNSLTQNSTYGAWAQRGLPGYRFVSLASNPEIPLAAIASNERVTQLNLLEPFMSTYDGVGTPGGLFDWTTESNQDEACFRAGVPLLEGNTIFSRRLEVRSRSECTNPAAADFLKVAPTIGQLLPTLYGGPTSPVDPEDVVFTWLTDSNLPSSQGCSPDSQGMFPTHCFTLGSEAPADLCNYDPKHLCGCDIYNVDMPAEVLRECKPQDRVILAMDRTAPEERRIPVAVALSCLAAGAGGFDVTEPPAIRTAADVGTLRIWLATESARIGEIQRRLFATGIPQAVVDYHANGFVPQGVVGSGERGDQILRIATALEAVARGFGVVQAGIDHLTGALGAAEVQFEAIELAQDQQLLGIALSKVDAGSQVAKGIVGVAAGLATAGNFLAAIATAGQSVVGGIAGTANGAIDIGAGIEKMSIMSEQQQLVALAQVNETARAINELNTAMLDGLREAEMGLSQISEAQLAVTMGLNAIKSREVQAGVAFANMSGEDFADINGDGNPDVAMPANTVYRRQYDITRQRYDRALHAAKRYTYLARLAIEQRLGVRMVDLGDAIGGLDAPNTWVDDLCSLTGVDYEALRTACADEGGSCVIADVQAMIENDIIAEFADQYIGDYVRKLEEFVEAYNVAYPFQDSEDMAVLSLQDILGGEGCGAPHENLLVSSGDLTVTQRRDAFVWQSSGCSADACTAAVASPPGGDALDPPVAPGGVSYLIQWDHTGTETSEFPNMIYQSVELEAGHSYELSWWDSAVPSADGQPILSRPYRVVVADSEWSPWALDLYDSRVPSGGTDWSERRVVQFSPSAGGTFHVGIQLLGEGAMAVGNVQVVDLAQAASSNAPYVHTDALGRDQCDLLTAGPLADQFDRICEGDVCYYQLRSSFSIAEPDILGAEFAHAGIPADNYNYRHLGVALNAVGTGLVDCEGEGASCFANSFLEYDLEHSAFRTRITNYGGEQECFSFGRGAVHRGKMLAAERMLGIPMSSTDEQLIADEDFMKPVLKGRPIDGVYQLRIYDRPGFSIEQLQDVQLVLKHVYWSRVERTPD